MDISFQPLSQISGNAWQLFLPNELKDTVFPFIAWAHEATHIERNYSGGVLAQMRNMLATRFSAQAQFENETCAIVGEADFASCIPPSYLEDAKKVAQELKWLPKDELAMVLTSLNYAHADPETYLEKHWEDGHYSLDAIRHIKKTRREDFLIKAAGTSIGIAAIIAALSIIF